MEIFPFGHENHGVARCDPIVMPLIVGGTKADRTEFPHMVIIAIEQYFSIHCKGEIK